MQTSDVDYNCVDNFVDYTGSVLICCVSSSVHGVLLPHHSIYAEAALNINRWNTYLYMIPLFRISACHPWFAQCPLKRLHCVCFAGWAKADANARPSQLIHDYWLTVRAAIFSRFYEDYMCE